MYFTLLSMADASETSIDIDFNCRGYCSNGTPTWSGSKVFTPGDTHTATATQEITWTKGSDSSPISPYWTVKGTMDGQSTHNTLTAEKDPLTIRCDVEVTTTPGCVFSWYKPTYVINSKKFPAAAAHAWLIQNKLPGHYGLEGVGEPLSYLADDVLVPGGSQLMSDAMTASQASVGLPGQRISRRQPSVRRSSSITGAKSSITGSITVM